MAGMNLNTFQKQFDHFIGKFSVSTFEMIQYNHTVNDLICVSLCSQSQAVSDGGKHYQPAFP